jgi:hypothetical protein
MQRERKNSANWSGSFVLCNNSFFLLLN